MQPKQVCVLKLKQNKTVGKECCLLKDEKAGLSLLGDNPAFL